jgi:hypothetical protein
MIAALPLAEQDHPLLSVFWTIFWVFMWMLWVFLVISILIDVFRSRNLSGWAKAAWTVLVVIFPLVGVLAYLIARGKSMAERQMGGAEGARLAGRPYPNDSVAASPSTAEEVDKLATLRDRGVITEQEFAAQKAKVLG